MNHHMNTVCPNCGNTKDNRARLCKTCFLSSGVARRGTGNYNNRINSGYMFVHLPDHRKANEDGYVKNSILVWEKANNTHIPDWFHIHHLDEDKLNDTPDNLIAVSPSDHIKLHRIWEWRLSCS